MTQDHDKNSSYLLEEEGEMECKEIEMKFSRCPYTFQIKDADLN